jgi:microcystin-dependent protein
MSDQFLGEIRMFGFSFPPANWASCDGRLIPIQQNAALFSLLGTQFGGNGTQTFGLPDLRGRVPIDWGDGNGLSPYVMGQLGGTETTTLLSTQMPQHNHTVHAATSSGTTSRPDSAVPAHAGSSIYAAAPDATVMNAGMIGQTGGSQPFNNLQPFLVVNFCIALVGIFPSRN